MSLVGCDDPARPSGGGPAGGDAGVPLDCTTQPCPLACKLVSLRVVSGAQAAQGADNWATLRHDGDIVVEAVTEPAGERCAAQVQWSGASGRRVPGQPAQRLFSAREAAKLEVRASLGGVVDELTLWVFWATVEILTRGTRPPNAKAHPPAGLGDGSNKLGAIPYLNLMQEPRVAGKIVAVATLAPQGVHLVVPGGWRLRRERMSRDWVAGKPMKPGESKSDFWNRGWVDDTLDEMAVLIPDVDDKIYDTDAPGLPSPVGSAETHNNFRQWVEFEGQAASLKVPWFFRAAWKGGKVVSAEVGAGELALPLTPTLK